jgi:hypothetical protein
MDRTAWKNAAPTGGIVIKLDIWVFFEIPYDGTSRL